MSNKRLSFIVTLVYMVLGLVALWTGILYDSEFLRLFFWPAMLTFTLGFGGVNDFLLLLIQVIMFVVIWMLVRLFLSAVRDTKF